MACLAITVQASGFAYDALGGVPGTLAHDVAGIARPLVAAATMYFIFNTCLIAVAVSLATRQSFIAVWNQNFLWSAPSYFVGAGAAAIATWAVMTSGMWLAVLADRAALPDLSHLQGLPRAHRRRAASRRGDGRSAPGDDRSARARDRRQGSDRAVAHPPRAGLRDQHRARARHVRHRDPGRQDGGAAARHRQARRARAHPVEARPADAGRVPEDPRPSAGRRRDHQRRAVPVSGRAADPQPPRTLGRQGLSAGAEGRRDSARRAHPLRRRLLRRADVRSSVPQGDDAGSGARAAAAGSGPRARSGGRADVREDGGRDGSGRGHHRNGDAAPPLARADQRARPPGRRLPARSDEEQHRLRRHRARAPRNLRALRNRADDGHEPWRRRHDGADLVEAVEPGAVLGVRAVPVRRGSRHAALPVCDRRRGRRDRHHDGARRPGPGRLGRAQPPAARQRAPERGVRGRRPRQVDDAAVGARRAAGLQRSLHRHAGGLLDAGRTSTPTITAACSIASANRPPPSSTTRSCSSRRRKIR